MSRRAYFTSSRGRSPLLPSPVRLTRSVMAHLDAIENIPSSNQRPARVSTSHKPHGRAMLARANKTQRKTTESGTENESSDDEVADDGEDEASDDNDDDDDDDDGDDESDQPATFAPPRGYGKHTLHKAGQIDEYRRMFHSEDPVLYEDPHDLFGGSIEDDDDDIYRAVDDISDEDEQNAEVFQLRSADAHAARSLLVEQPGSPFSPLDSEHEADYILGQVDGLSAYGFGDDLDTDDGSVDFSAPSEAGDITPLPERHVHFSSDVERLNAYGQSASPSLTRALLPSAMPFDNGTHIYALDEIQTSTRPNVPTAAQDPYDSDATEVVSPPPTPLQSSSAVVDIAVDDVKYLTPSTTDHASGTKKSRNRTSRRRKGPPRGIFTVDQDKSWAILDSTGKKILQIPAANTNRHAWLDEMSQSNSTPPSSTSPLNASLRLRGEEVPAVVAPAAGFGMVLSTALPDVMMAGLSAKKSFAEMDQGQAVGPPEAFYSNGLQHVGGDYAVSPEPESDAYDEATPSTKKPSFPLQEFLEDFGDDSSEDVDSELPLYAPVDDNLTGDNDPFYCHLNNVNITSFRRSADAMTASRPMTSYSYDLQNSPIAGSFALPAAPLRTPPSHKRKVSSTPYHDEKIYGDVTPVERKVIHGPKRRKMAT